MAVLPENGCDIVEVDRPLDGRRRDGAHAVGLSDVARSRARRSLERFLEPYSGGWQVLLPNGGDATEQHGVEWGFHGEAGIIEWRVDAHDDAGARLSASLMTAPLEIEREIRVRGRALEVVERVRNAGDESIDVMWGHHPAFGAPLIEPGCTISTGARTFIADDREPGAGLEPGATSSWPHARLASGGTIDLSVIPPARRAPRGARLPRRLRRGDVHDLEPADRARGDAQVAARSLPERLVLAGAARLAGLSVVQADVHHRHRAQHYDPGTGHRRVPASGAAFR